MGTVLENLRALCTAPGTPGQEYAASGCAARLLREFAPDARVDAFGNVMGTIPCEDPHAPTLLLDAHMDEIGLIVTEIDDKGFLKVARCGGMDRRLLAAQPVRVYTKTGVLGGMIGSKPPHLESKEDAKKVPEITDLFVDIGMEPETAKETIRPGDRVVIESGLVELLNGRVSGKALDDRSGVAAILEALRQTVGSGEALPVRLAVLFSGREETGGQGARIGSFSLAPDWAIAVDVSFAAQPGVPAEKCGKLGKGPMIGIAPALDAALSASLVQLAREAEIPFQQEVMGGTTGTNADDIGISRAGVRTGLLSIPQRNMHTPVEIVQISDVEDTARLLAEWIRKGVGLCEAGTV